MRGHTARKRFGQNFLVDAHYVAKIVVAIDPMPGVYVVEIGPGRAALTGPEPSTPSRSIAISRRALPRTFHPTGFGCMSPMRSISTTHC